MFTSASILITLVAAVANGDTNLYTEALGHKRWKNSHRYVEVRPGAFIFYWLYYADGTSHLSETKPLIIWIQGGPGIAASGIGNFFEIGPLDIDFKPRNHTWVKGRNLLLIDHPVGTGFSYAVNYTLYAKSDMEMANDLSKTIKVFLKYNKRFRATPTYLIGQSYGGKICPRLAWYLNTAITTGSLKMNLKGIGIGGGWVDPRESTISLPPCLYNAGLIDRPVYRNMTRHVRNIVHYIDKEDYIRASALNIRMLSELVTAVTGPLNFLNFNEDSPDQVLVKLRKRINQYVKPTLWRVNQTLNWTYQSYLVFRYLDANFLMASAKFLELLLNNTNLKVAIYNGNLDVGTPIAGAVNWVHKLRWSGAEDFREKRRVRIGGDNNGFYKKVKQLTLWTVFEAGHWVPDDNPTAMEQILQHLILD